jgi:DNA-binding response OmpR family regulator
MEPMVKILVVDDNEQNLTLIRVILRRCGYNACLARSGEEALQQVINDPPDLIILDVMMPGLDGIEVCRRLKDEEETRLIPIVIMTALNQLQDKIRGIEAGADDFLTKPVNQAELMARVRTALKVKRTIDHKVQALIHTKEHLAKFVPLAVRRLVEANPEAPALTKREQDVSALFLDVSGYAHLSQQLPPDVLNALVERYFSLFLDRIQEAGGDINETAGDGFMAIFHDANVHVHARKAAGAALALLAATVALNGDNPKQPLTIHLGINSGMALVGSTRFEGLRGPRWTYTASGPVTNLAARLGAAAAPGTILVGPETAKRIAAGFFLDPLGSQTLKNLEAVEVYRLVREK